MSVVLYILDESRICYFLNRRNSLFLNLEGLITGQGIKKSQNTQTFVVNMNTRSLEYSHKNTSVILNLIKDLVKLQNQEALSNLLLASRIIYSFIHDFELQPLSFTGFRVMYSSLHNQQRSNSCTQTKCIPPMVRSIPAICINSSSITKYCLLHSIFHTCILQQSALRGIYLAISR